MYIILSRRGKKALQFQCIFFFDTSHFKIQLHFNLCFHLTYVCVNIYVNIYVYFFISIFLNFPRDGMVFGSDIISRKQFTVMPIFCAIIFHSFHFQFLSFVSACYFVFITSALVGVSKAARRLSKQLLTLRCISIMSVNTIMFLI